MTGQAKAAFRLAMIAVWLPSARGTVTVDPLKATTLCPGVADCVKGFRVVEPAMVPNGPYVAPLRPVNVSCKTHCQPYHEPV